MAGLSVIVLMGALGILFIIFIIFNILLLTLIVLTIVFGIIRAVKKKFKKTFIVFLILTIILTVLDVTLIFVVHNKIVSSEDTGESKEIIAVKYDKYNVVKENIVNGWNPNESPSAIYYAIKNNSEENKENDEWPMLELLLKNGANPNVQISESPTGVNTPLTFTVECGYYGATKLLLEYGADVNYKENRFGYTPIKAIRYWENDKAAETLELLIENDADLNIEDNNGETGLDELQQFEKDYKKNKNNVPDYNDIVEILEKNKILN